jgi:hypothetical protein
MSVALTSLDPPLKFEERLNLEESIENLESLALILSRLENDCFRAPLQPINYVSCFILRCMKIEMSGNKSRRPQTRLTKGEYILLATPSI